MSPDKIRVGCSGWSYKDWAGIFYPKDLPAGEYLKFYSKYFNCVEIDSSFYRIPSSFMVEQWRKNSPEGFKFSPKLPKKITHEGKLVGFESRLSYFYSVVRRLGDKLGPIIVQLPPSMKLDKHRSVMEAFVPALDPKFQHAIEFRHKSWFVPEVYELLRKNGVAMVWSLNQYLETPPEVTSKFAVLRMIGDRELTEFTGVQRDMSEDAERWAKNVRDNINSIDDAFVFFNNHFAGFSPESANEFRRLLGLMETDWRQDLASGPRQQSLADF